LNWLGRQPADRPPVLPALAVFLFSILFYLPSATGRDNRCLDSLIAISLRRSPVSLSLVPSAEIGFGCFAV
jgi:hypothetical protein